MVEDLKAITKTYDLILWSIPQVVKFPRSHRFVLGERIENNLYELLEELIEAKYSKDKISVLRQANLRLEKIRYQIRIAKDLKFMALSSYEYAAKNINEIGNLIGGWIKQQGNKQNE